MNTQKRSLLMKCSLPRGYRRWLMVLLVALNTIFGALPAFAQGNGHAVAYANDNHQRVLLTLAGDAVAPNTVQLNLTATPLLDAPALHVEWEIGSAQMTGGASDETLGAQAAGVAMQESRSVSLPGQGTYPLKVNVTFEMGPEQQYGASTMLFALVNEQGAVTLTARDPNAVNPMHSQMATEVTQLDGQVNSAGAEEANGDPCFTITGVVTRQDLFNTRFGRQAALTVPVRQAIVEMREEDLMFDDSYGTTFTDDQGNYSFIFCDDDGAFDNTLELYVRLRAEIVDGDDMVVHVTDASFIDETYEFDSAIIKSSGGTFKVNFALDANQSIIFNIADAILDGYNFFNVSGGASGQDAFFDYTTKAQWEPGYGETQTHYNPYTFDDLILADAPANPDGWDDSVILHEWGHEIDDKYGCDDNPGGFHSVGQILADPELAWGEAYPDYWQSAVRAGLTDGSFYIDADGNGKNLISTNFERTPSNPNANVEFALASMLWDLADSAKDGQDRTGVGHPELQKVYTDPVFSSNGDAFDDTCTVNQYLLAWAALGEPTDAATAASITQNIGLASPFPATAQAAVAQSADLTADAGIAQSASFDDAGPAGGDYTWWQQVTMVADNSASMAGAKLDGVKSAMKSQVQNLQDAPDGVEFGLYTFNNNQAGSQEVARGRFYADAFLPDIDGLQSTSGGAEPCQVNAFDALASSIQDKHDGEAWLYTDGETNPGPGVEAMQELLNTRSLHGSFVMMGGCNSLPDPQPDTAGAAYNFLGNAADGSQPAGIVPYLLTSIATGGNFLFVNDQQLADAGDILRAQLSHSAGAGRWSDYVSSLPTYSFDKLTSWEYNWIEPAQADYRGQAVDNELEIPISPVTVFGQSFNALTVDGQGYLQMGPIVNGPQPFASQSYLNVLNAGLNWQQVLSAQTKDANATPDAPQSNYFQAVSAGESGDWVVVTTEGSALSGDARAYQVLINKASGEIRYQYHDVPDGDAGDALIGLMTTSPAPNSQVEVLASNKDESGADAGMGYKFIPLPAQPSKSFTVPVDGQMDGVGFLLTGYSGSFAPLAVTDPNGAPLDCNAPGSLCLNLGLVQYVQSNVDGRNGDWHVTVTPGASGAGTFSFSAMAASAIKVASPFSHQLTFGEASPLTVNLGAPAGGDQLTAWLQHPDGSAMGGQFALFDDGQHGDGKAGDGKFALPNFVPPAVGVGYLTVQGVVNGSQVQRSDASPYNFQPIKVEGPATLPYLGTGDVVIDYTVTNLGDKSYCFEPSIQMAAGWNAQWNEPSALCLNPNTSSTRHLQVTPVSLQDPAPSGAQSELVVSFREQERGQMVASAATTLVRYNAPAQVAIENNHSGDYLRPNGSDTVNMLVMVLDDQGFPVVDGAQVQLSATLGAISPAQGGTVNGKLPIIFTAGTSQGDAVIEAKVVGTALATQSVVHIQNAQPEALVFNVDKLDLSKGSIANMVVSVHDAWGDPLAGQLIRIGVGDEHGVVAAAGQVAASAIQASSVVTLTTDTLGQAAATFSKDAAASGQVTVRAELLYDDGTGQHVALSEERTFIFTGGGAFGMNIYLPAIEGTK